MRFHVYQVALIDREFSQLGFLQTDLSELSITLEVTSGCPDRSEDQSSS